MKFFTGTHNIAWSFSLFWWWHLHCWLIGWHAYGLSLDKQNSPIIQTPPGQVRNIFKHPTENILSFYPIVFPYLLPLIRSVPFDCKTFMCPREYINWFNHMIITLWMHFFDALKTWKAFHQILFDLLLVVYCVPFL